MDADVPDRREQTIGLALALSSSVFIGSSFIVKKRGLRLAGASGLRAGSGGFSYLRQPIWWAGMISMIVGEVANFAAYAFAPAILVTPLGALSIIVSAILAHLMLNEKLNLFGMLGCLLCINGAVTIVLHAPPERPIVSVLQVWKLAQQPSFAAYALAAVALILYLVFVAAPRHGSTNIFVYIGICSLAGSLSVMSCKALGVALKLTFQGSNQLVYVETYVFILVVTVCVLTQMIYLNKALDLFNTAVVSPVYYVMFTVLTILASVALFRDIIQTPLQLATEVCGFVCIVSGTFLLHTTKDLDLTVSDLDQLTRSEEGSGGGARVTGGAAGVGVLGGAAQHLRERRSAAAAAVEMAKQAAMEAGEGGSDGDDEPLVGGGGGGASNGVTKLGARSGARS